jgi:hypothetical protein
MEEQYGGLEVRKAKRLAAIEEENTKLKRLLADAMLYNAALSGSAGKKWWRPSRARKRWGICDEVSQWSNGGRAQWLLRNRSSVRYRRRRPDDDLLRERLKTLAHQRRRFRIWRWSRTSARMSGASSGYVDLGLRVARELDFIIAVRGRSKTIASDKGTALTSTAILA